MNKTADSPDALPMRPTEIARRYLLSASHKLTRISDLLTTVATMNATQLTLDQRADLIIAGREATRNAAAIKRLADSVDAPALALVTDLPPDET